MSTVKEIGYEEALSLGDPVFVDVRAPVEYALDHIPGALNIPVLDDHERAEVGTMYRHAGQESAILEGTRIVGSKLASIVERITALGDRGVVIYCFRGGMRSASISALLGSLGIPVFRLAQGYKGYRRWVRARLGSLSIGPPVFVLHGLTGTGKTQVLRRLDSGIDLEDFAGHRSSVFGGLGLVPRSQKLFEGHIIGRVDELSGARYVVLEGESRKIGDLHVPPPLLGYINAAPGILLTAPIERRVRILMDDYAEGLNREELKKIVALQERRMGHANVAHLLALLDSGDLPSFTELLLKKYYDPLYAFSLDRMKFVARIENLDSAAAAAKLAAIADRILCGRNS